MFEVGQSWLEDGAGSRRVLGELSSLQLGKLTRILLADAGRLFGLSCRPFCHPHRLSEQGEVQRRKLIDRPKHTPTPVKPSKRTKRIQFERARTDQLPRCREQLLRGGWAQAGPGDVGGLGSPWEDSVSFYESTHFGIVSRSTKRKTTI